MNTLKLTAIALLAFLLPLGVVLVQNLDTIQQRFEIDPKTNKGRLLYFTLPAR